MLLTPAIWWLVVRRRDGAPRPPWGAFTLVMLPFLVDVTGNSFDLYDALAWWDDLNHFANWFLLCAGLGLIVCGSLHRPWATVLVVTGLGAILAIGWELGEWYTFIRHGTELDTAYEDTLGDEALGTFGALLAGLLVARLRSRDPAVHLVRLEPPGEQPPRSRTHLRPAGRREPARPHPAGRRADGRDRAGDRARGDVLRHSPPRPDGTSGHPPTPQRWRRRGMAPQAARRHRYPRGDPAAAVAGAAPAAEGVARPGARAHPGSPSWLQWPRCTPAAP